MKFRVLKFLLSLVALHCALSALESVSSTERELADRVRVRGEPFGYEIASRLSPSALFAHGKTDSPDTEQASKGTQTEKLTTTEEERPGASDRQANGQTGGTKSGQDPTGVATKASGAETQTDPSLSGPQSQNGQEETKDQLRQPISLNSDLEHSNEQLTSTLAKTRPAGEQAELFNDEDFDDLFTNPNKAPQKPESAKDGASKGSIPPLDNSVQVSQENNAPQQTAQETSTDEKAKEQQQIMKSLELATQTAETIKDLNDKLNKVEQQIEAQEKPVQKGQFAQVQEKGQDQLLDEKRETAKTETLQEDANKQKEVLPDQINIQKTVGDQNELGLVDREKSIPVDLQNKAQSLQPTQKVDTETEGLLENALFNPTQGANQQTVEKVDTKLPEPTNNTPTTNQGDTGNNIEKTLANTVQNLPAESLDSFLDQTRQPETETQGLDQSSNKQAENLPTIQGQPVTDSLNAGLAKGQSQPDLPQGQPKGTGPIEVVDIINKEVPANQINSLIEDVENDPEFFEKAIDNFVHNKLKANLQPILSEGQSKEQGMGQTVQPVQSGSLGDKNQPVIQAQPTQNLPPYGTADESQTAVPKTTGSLGDKNHPLVRSNQPKQSPYGTTPVPLLNPDASTQLKPAIIGSLGDKNHPLIKPKFVEGQSPYSKKDPDSSQPKTQAPTFVVDPGTTATFENRPNTTDLVHPYTGRRPANSQPVFGQQFPSQPVPSSQVPYNQNGAAALAIPLPLFQEDDRSSARTSFPSEAPKVVVINQTNAGSDKLLDSLKGQNKAAISEMDKKIAAAFEKARASHQAMLNGNRPSPPKSGRLFGMPAHVIRKKRAPVSSPPKRKRIIILVKSNPFLEDESSLLLKSLLSVVLLLVMVVM